MVCFTVVVVKKKLMICLSELYHRCHNSMTVMGAGSGEMNF